MTSEPATSRSHQNGRSYALTSIACLRPSLTRLKAIDVIPPAGVQQSVELDYLLGPVVLKGVVIP